MLQDLSSLGFGGKGIPDAMPAALAELQGITFYLTTGAGANTNFTVPNIEPEDTLKAVLNLTDLTQMNEAHFTIQDRRATATFILHQELVDGDKCQLNGKTYTFVEVDDVDSIAFNMAPRTIPFEADPSGPVDLGAVTDLFAQVIMSSDSNFEAVSDGVDDVAVFWRVPGTVGNGKALGLTGANSGITRSGTVTAGGTATHSIQSTDSSSAKKVLVIWLDKSGAV